jgi:hypothetical protein
MARKPMYLMITVYNDGRGLEILFGDDPTYVCYEHKPHEQEDYLLNPAYPPPREKYDDDRDPVHVITQFQYEIPDALRGVFQLARMGELNWEHKFGGRPLHEAVALPWRKRPQETKPHANREGTLVSGSIVLRAEGGTLTGEWVDNDPPASSDAVTVLPFEVLDNTSFLPAFFHNEELGPKFRQLLAGLALESHKQRLAKK